MMKSIFGSALLLSLAFSPAAFAQMYIVPATDCGAVTLNVARAGEAGVSAAAIQNDRIQTARFLSRRFQTKAKPADGTESLTFDAEISAADEIAMAALSLKPEVVGNETRAEHAKALMFCGDATPDADWQGSLQLGLEIYPQRWNGPRPKMKAGDTMKFIAVARNESPKPLSGLSMELSRVGEGRMTQAIVDGIFMTFPLPTPGRYMVATTYRRPDPEKKDHWLVDTSTLTFEVK